MNVEKQLKWIKRGVFVTDGEFPYREYIIDVIEHEAKYKAQFSGAKLHSGEGIDIYLVCSRQGDYFIAHVDGGVIHLANELDEFFETIPDDVFTREAYVALMKDFGETPAPPKLRSV